MQVAAGLDRRRLELSLPATTAAIGDARAAVDRLEALSAHPDARFAVRLLISELFTNAVKYGAQDGVVRLAIDVRDSHVRVEVGDRGRGFDGHEVAMPGPDEESGRGLAFLDALATRWGVIRNGESCIWFEVDV